MVQLHSTYVYMLHSSWLAVSSCDVWQPYCGTWSRCLSEVQGGHARSGRVNAIYKVHVVSLLCQRGVNMEHHTEVGEGGEGRVEGGVRW